MLRTSTVLRRHAAEGKVVLGINHRMVDFGTGRAKNLDLVFARPDGAATTTTLALLAERYDISLTPTQRADLRKLGGWSVGRVGAVLVALEAKAVMTAHIRALPRLYDELNSSHLCVHGSSRHALAIGFAMVNASPLFVSSDLNKRLLAGSAPTVSRETQPKALIRTLQKLAEIPRRSNVRENGFDGFGVVVVNGVNDTSHFSLVTAPPAPQPGESFHYDSMIARMSNEYDATYGRM